jgi:hypothetical protein
MNQWQADIFITLMAIVAVSSSHNKQKQLFSRINFLISYFAEGY